MQPRRHRMRQRQRRYSTREWIRSRATVTVRTYARRYGVDRYTAYEDLAALGFVLPASARQWARRSPATLPHGRAARQPCRARVVDRAGWQAVLRRRLHLGCSTVRHVRRRDGFLRQSAVMAIYGT